MDLVTIGEYTNASEGELAPAFLEANGIRAFISGAVAVLAAEGVPLGANRSCAPLMSRLSLLA
jgi:hypothetical protein